MFTQVWKKSRKNIISVVVVEFFEVLFFTPKSKVMRRLKAFILLYSVLGVLMYVISDLAQVQNKIILLPTLIATFICSFCLFLVYWLYDMTLTDVENVIIPSIVGDDTEKRLAQWAILSASIWKQLLVSVLFTLIIYRTFYIINAKYGLPFNLQDTLVLMIFISFIGGGQGLYWAFSWPGFIEQLYKSDMKEFELYVLDPSRSPIFVVISRWFTMFSLSLGIGFSTVIILLFSMQADFSSVTIYYTMAIIGTGYIVGAWVFLYPQYLLLKMVRKAKEFLLKPVRVEILKIYKNSINNKNADFDRMNNLTELYEKILKSPNTVINLRTLWPYLTSLAAPPVVAIVGFIDFGKSLQSLFSI